MQGSQFQSLPSHQLQQAATNTRAQYSSPATSKSVPWSAGCWLRGWVPGLAYALLLTGTGELVLDWYLWDTDYGITVVVRGTLRGGNHCNHHGVSSFFWFGQISSSVSDSNSCPPRIT